jgi:hypothetical protein
MEKIALLINRGFQILGQKLDNLSSELRNKKSPIINSTISISEDVSKGISQAVERSLNKLNIPAPEITFPKYPDFPEIKIPEIKIPQPIINLPAPEITVNPTAVEFPKEMAIVGMAELLASVSRETQQKGLLEGISTLNPIPMMIVDKKGKQIVNFGADISIPTSIELRIGASKISGSHPLPVAMGFQVPIYDTEIIDTSLAPATTTITYKKSGVVVATKTITVAGTLTTITVV